ncbi:MAG: aldo/keto reductase [Alphaproteobacteria bacterium]
MKYNKLGNTDIDVSAICLGSMTWGSQNSTEEGHAQIDMALERGVNIIDTAEMYPTTPISADTQGETERIIGRWNAKSGRRDEVLIATKVAGEGFRGIRDGAPISPETITIAVETSLQALQTDYIDLYQLHWPNRGSYAFRQNWRYDPRKQDKQATIEHMLAVLEKMDELCKQGKVRYFGLSNESAWGTSQWVRFSEDRNLPRVMSIQNEYSLLCRLFDTDLAELCHNEQIGLFAYSPLACGMLTGKYQNGATPAGSRKSIGPELGGRVTERVWPVIEAYLDIARRHGLDPSQMALAWAMTRPAMMSLIIGATSTEQLDCLLGAPDLDLSDEVIEEIEATHRAHPMPF